MGEFSLLDLFPYISVYQTLERNGLSQRQATVDLQSQTLGRAPGSVNCLNSVDMSTVLEITLAWYRLVCANGLMRGNSEQ